jgi:hypothetical protein
MEINELKKIITLKTKARENTDLLKYVVSECERTGKTVVNFLEKLRKDNEETYRVSGDAKYLEENKEIDKYLPTYVSVEELVSILSPLNLDKTGKSIGIATKTLKEKGVSFKNEDVKRALGIV